jgi:aminoglycoside phosphotransferase family enzyme/predicted kinase
MHPACMYAKSELTTHGELIEALRRQLGARLIETHISWVLLAGDAAWKIKKPVQLGFLDFGTLAARRHMCDEELRLNRRLAPTLYLDVQPITGTPQAPVLGGCGTPIEWALQMRRFADGALLSERLAAGSLEPALVDQLARRLAAFHAAAPAAEGAAPWGTPERIDGDMRAVIERLAERTGADLQPLRAWAQAQAGALHETWLERRRSGCVREGHGDLHLANVVVLGDDVTAFDCIEFDPALRWIDVQADIGFLVMDLLAHRRTDLAFRFVDRYLAFSGDHAGLGVLRYYIVYRALVRALVGTMRPDAGAPDYLALALRWLQPPGARLLITHGVSGSGKSYVAERMLERMGAIRLRSDVERKRLFGLAPLEPSGAKIASGIYGGDATCRTYARLETLADGALRVGWPVIVDATFLRAEERAAFRRLAQRHGVPFGILHCEVPPALLEQRLAERARRADDPSEADAAVVAHQRPVAEALGPAELAEVTAVDDMAEPAAEARLSVVRA